eukprot:m.20418 g.20418  ORF g.20418 m.20418 type:complete len:84 (-) comp8573_c0_seq1:65-316(-)
MKRLQDRKQDRKTARQHTHTQTQAHTPALTFFLSFFFFFLSDLGVFGDFGAFFGAVRTTKKEEYKMTLEQSTIYFQTLFVFIH